jgi:hypothetical protein
MSIMTTSSKESGFLIDDDEELHDFAETQNAFRDEARTYDNDDIMAFDSDEDAVQENEIVTGYRRWNTLSPVDLPVTQRESPPYQRWPGYESSDPRYGASYVLQSSASIPEQYPLPYRQSSRPATHDDDGLLSDPE